MQDQKLTKPKTTRTISPYEATQLAKYNYPPEQFVASQTQPVEYATGWVSFYGQEFKVTPAVLIPRVETEELVDHVLRCCHQQYHQLKRQVRILEVGTGSGALGLSLATVLTQQALAYDLVMSDVSDSALHIAQTNQERLLPGAPITFHQGFLLNTLPHQTFDVILANLPYIPSSRLPMLDPSVRDHEPSLALDGGQDGLELIGRLLHQAPQFSQPKTEIWLEIDEFHTWEQLSNLAPQKNIQLIDDSFGKVRFAHITGDV